MTFFEAPAGPPPQPFTFPEFPPWAGPPDAEIGAVVALEQLVARTANAVVLMPTVRVYSTGAMLNVEITARQGDLDPESWFDLESAAVLSFPGRNRVPGLSRRLLRLGVRLRDGSKATTLDPPRWRGDADPPPGPVLQYSPQSSGGRSGAHTHNFGMWLWPLPPAEPFEFAVEWPAAGLDLTIVELDGALIRGAASRSRPYWTA